MLHSIFNELERLEKGLLLEAMSYKLKPNGRTVKDLTITLV